MAFIYETKNFVVESHERPEIDRLEGGHIKISPKIEIEDRTQLTSKQAIELMRLTIITGVAMKKGMKKSGVNIGRINYQDNGNWTPHLHIHLYGRAVDARIQKFGEPIIDGHRDEYKQLNSEDVENIRTEIVNEFKLDKFSDTSWRL